MTNGVFPQREDFCADVCFVPATVDDFASSAPTVGRTIVVSGVPPNVRSVRDYGRTVAFLRRLSLLQGNQGRHDIDPSVSLSLFDGRVRKLFPTHAHPLLFP